MAVDLQWTMVFGAGVLSFASPCVLPLVPVYLASMAGTSVSALREGVRPARLMVNALAFSLGLVAVFVALGAAAGGAAAVLATHRATLARVAGVAVALFGLRSLGVLRVPWLEREFRPGLQRVSTGASAAGAFLFGAAFALGWTPCVGPVLGAVLTYAAGHAARPAAAAGYLALYGAGLALPLIASAAFAPVALRAMQRMRSKVVWLERATGLLLLVVGVLMASGRLGALAPGEAGAAAAAHCAGTSATCGLPEGGAVGGGGGGGAVASALPAGPAMVEFFGESCPVCARMAPVVEAVERRCRGAGAQVVRVDVDADGGVALARRHGVVGLPTFVSLGADGREVARLVGEQSAASLASLLDATGGGCRAGGAS